MRSPILTLRSYILHVMLFLIALLNLVTEYFAIREGVLSENPEEIILHKISEVLDIYNFATIGGVN